MTLTQQMTPKELPIGHDVFETPIHIYNYDNLLQGYSNDDDTTVYNDMMEECVLKHIFTDEVLEHTMGLFEYITVTNIIDSGMYYNVQYVLNITGILDEVELSGIDIISSMDLFKIDITA